MDHDSHERDTSVPAPSSTNDQTAGAQDLPPPGAAPRPIDSSCALEGPNHQPRALPTAAADLPEVLRTAVEYRKSGLSLNHVVGCPLDCGYCVRHLFDNFDMKQPHLILDDEEAVDALINHPAFRPHTTPIQLFNRATDPFLPTVKEHLYRTLQLLDAQGLKNLVLVITRWRVDGSDVARLESLRHLRVTVLVTWSGISDARIEPVDSDVAAASLSTLSQRAVRTKRILYWRPVVAGLNDSDDCISRARELSKLADSTVFTGLFHREQIRSYLRSVGVEDLYQATARRKVMPRDVERRILARFGNGPIFRKTSCGVSYAHGIPDYNGHYGIKHICDICPTSQVGICKTAHRRPTRKRTLELLATAGIPTEHVGITDGHVLVEGSTEQQRYFVQHTLGFQVHDQAHPHLPERHGRAEEGWQ